MIKAEYKIFYVYIFITMPKQAYKKGCEDTIKGDNKRNSEVERE